MGLNYYHHINICQCCGRSESVHIGKASFGWSFSFHGTEEIRSYQDWLKVLETGEIRDEYERPVALEEFKELVESKRDGRNHAKEFNDGHRESWIDNEGHSFGNYEFS